MPYEPPPLPSLCEWLGGFHAVVGGTVTSVTLVDTPMAHWSGIGADWREVITDSSDCGGYVDLALRLEIDVTDVFYGEAALGPIEIRVGSSPTSTMYPRPQGKAGDTPWWDGAGENVLLSTGSWVGLPLIFLPERGWSLVKEMPFTADDRVALAEVEYCGNFDRPADLDGMAFDEFVEQATVCVPTPTEKFDRRLTIVERYSGEAYSARCYAAVVIHECDVDADCLNATVCQKNQCVVPGYGG